MTQEDKEMIARDLADSAVQKAKEQGERRRINLDKIRDTAYSLALEQDGQDIAEYAVLLAVVLVLVIGTIRLLGSNATNVFSSIASSLSS